MIYSCLTILVPEHVLQLFIDRTAPPLPPGLPPSVHNILSKCLDFDPASRPGVDQVIEVNGWGMIPRPVFLRCPWFHNCMIAYLLFSVGRGRYDWQNKLLFFTWHNNLNQFLIV